MNKQSKINNQIVFKDMCYTYLDIDKHQQIRALKNTNKQARTALAPHTKTYTNSLNVIKQTHTQNADRAPPTKGHEN